MSDTGDALLLQMSADISKLEKAMQRANKAVDDGAGHVEARAKKMAANLEKTFGEVNVGEALEKTFSRARFGVLEEGGAKIGVFGSALEALGPAGLTAAAGLAAVGIAMEQAKAAAEYSEAISNTAAKLGITTKALQEYQFAALASGVSVDAMNEALEEGNAKLGEFQTNLGSAKVKKVFEALGITPAEAAQAKNITDLLPQISEKMQGLSASAQEAVAKRAGLEGIVNVLRKGPEAIAELRTEAEKSGAVLDSELIEKGKRAAEALKEASDIVAVNLHRAFVDLAPVIETCARLVGTMARDLADGLEAFGGIAHMSRAGVQGAQQETTRALGTWGAAASFGGAKLDRKTGLMTGGGATGSMGAVGMYNYFVGQKGREDARVKELDAIDAAEAAKTRRGSSAPLVQDKEKKPKRGPQDQTADFDKSATDAFETGAKDLADAQAQLVKNVLDRAQAEKDAVDADTTKRLKDLGAEEAKIRASKNDAHKRDQLSLLLGAEADAATAQIARKEAIDRKTQEEIAAHQLELAGELSSTMASNLDAMAALASLASQRRALELKALGIRQDQEDKALAAQRATDLQEHPDNGAYWDQRRGELDASQSLARTRVLQSTDSPGQAFDRKLHDQNDGAADAMQGIEVSGVEQLGDALDELVMKTKTAKAAFHDMAMAIAGDMLKMATQRFIETPIADALFPKPKAQVSIGGALGDALPGASGGMGGLTSSATAAASSISMLAAAALRAATSIGVSGVLGNSSGVAGAHDVDTSGFAAIDAMKLPSLLGFASGGHISGPGGGRDDSILARVSNGEFIVNAAATRQNLGLLHAINNGSLGRYADGGLLGIPTDESGPEAYSEAPQTLQIGPRRTS